MPLEVGLSSEKKPWIAFRNHWTNDCMFTHSFENEEFFEVFRKLKEIYQVIKPEKRTYNTTLRRLKRLKAK